MEQNAPKRDMVSRLARLLGGGLALVMLGSAAWHTIPYISSAGQAAATWLGDQTGAPQGALGRPTPDDPLCWIHTRDNWSSSPFCAGVRNGLNAGYDVPLYVDIPWPERNWDNSSTAWGFYSATLSAGAADADPSGDFETDTFWDKGYQQIKYLGRAQFDKNWRTVYPPDGITCNKYAGTKDAGNTTFQAYRYTDGGYQIYRVPIISYFAAPPWGRTADMTFLTANIGETTNSPNGAHCWLIEYGAPTPKDGGLAPATPGQTAFAVSEWGQYKLLENKGAADDRGRCPAGSQNYESNLKYIAGGPSATDDAWEGGDKYYFDELGRRRCFTVQRNPGNVLHISQHVDGKPAVVAPGETIAIQWSCQPSRTVYHGGTNGAGEYYNALFYNLPSIFTTSSGSRSAGAPAFSTGGRISGIAKIPVPANQPYGTYTYSVTCSNSASNPIPPETLSVDIKVGPKCTSPVSSERVLSGTDVVGYRLLKGTARTYDVFGISFCVYNGTDNDYFVPVKTKTEYQEFIDAATAGIGEGDGKVIKN